MHRQQGRDRLEIIAHAVVHLLKQGRLDRQGALALIVEPRILDGDGGLVGEGAQQAHLLVVEEVRLALVETDPANGALAGAQGMQKSEWKPSRAATLAISGKRASW